MPKRAPTEGTPKKPKPRRTYGSGSVYQRRGRWVAALRLPDGARRYLPADSEAAAKALLRQAATGELGPARKRGSTVTLAAWLDTWITAIAPRRAGESTIRRYQIDVRRWTAALGKRRLPDLTIADVQRTLARWQDDGLAAGSVHNAWAMLRTALNAAIREGIIVRNVAALAQQRTPEQRAYPTVTPDLAARVLAAVAGRPLALPVMVALATGLRQGELLGLTWADLDLDAATLTVRRQLQRRAGAYVRVAPKTARSRRTVPLPAVAVAALRQRRTEQAQERLRAGATWQEPLPDLVWETPTGRPRHGTTLTHQLQAALVAADLPRLRWHDLRHGAASLLLTEGVAARVVMELLGHTQIGTTLNLYSHVAPELTRLAADSLDRALGGAQPGRA